MHPFNSKNKHKRPKFLFNLQINELVNVPQSTGNCFVKWRFKDGTGISSKKISPEVNIETSKQSSGATRHVTVKHHKAQWNYTLDKPIQIKLEVNKSDTIVPKYIDFEVYLETVKPVTSNHPDEASNNSEHSTPRKSNIFRSPTLKSTNTSISFSSSASSINYDKKTIIPNKITGKLFLGHVLVNITEYISPREEPVSNKFLLKDSKINSILTMSFQLKLIRGSYNEFKLSDQLSNFYQPGIANFLDNNNANMSIETVTNSSNLNSSTSNSIMLEERNIKSPMSTPLASRFTSSKFSNVVSSKDIPTASNTMSPLIQSLYEKTFQLPWDERPNEYTPRECIDDILKGGNGWAKNENGINLIDLQALRLTSFENGRNSNYYNDHSANIINNTGKNKNSNELQDDDNYWNNMNKREFLEKKNQQDWNQAYSAPTAKISRSDVNNTNGGYDQFDNPDETALTEDPKSWSIKKNLV